MRKTSKTTTRMQQDAATTLAIPDAIFSPMSCSLSEQESSPRYQSSHEPMGPPPLPSSPKTNNNQSSRMFLSLPREFSTLSVANHARYSSKVNHSRNVSKVWGASTSKDVQDLRAYIDNMAFSPQNKEHVHVLVNNQATFEPKSRSRKVFHDRTNGTSFHEMTTTNKTTRNNSSPKLAPTMPRSMGDKKERKGDPPAVDDETSLSADLPKTEENAEEKYHAWTSRIEDMAAKVRHALDPEPSSGMNYFEEASMVLRTAFTELGPEEDTVSRQDVSSCHTSFLHKENEIKSQKDINSPEDAKKLLRAAVHALNDARAEREAARLWATSMKEDVNKWVDEQRKLIQSETTTRMGALEAHEVQIQAQTASLSKLDSSIQALYEEIVDSNQSRETTEKRIQRLLLTQQDKIHSLGRQLSSIEQTVTEQGTRSSMTSRADASGHVTSPRDAVIPRFVDKTPRGPGDSRASSSSSRIKRRTKDGGHVVAYSNGVQKEVHPDGTTVIRFTNGDVETKFADSGTVAYFHKEDLVLQITTADGSTLFEYSNHQVERHYPDGSKAILYPDGTKQRISPKGRVQTLSAAD